MYIFHIQIMKKIDRPYLEKFTLVYGSEAFFIVFCHIQGQISQVAFNNILEKKPNLSSLLKMEKSQLFFLAFRPFFDIPDPKYHENSKIPGRFF